MYIASQSVSLDFLRSRATRGTLEILASETMLCFECGEKLQERDGELVCTGCGVVWGNGVFEDNHIPFEENNQRRDFEGRWMPGNQLAFNKGLGTHQWLSRGSFCRVILPVGKKDMGIRATHLKSVTTKTEHPWIIALLSYGSEICKEYGLHKDDDACHRFADEYGKVLRRVGSYIIIRGRHWNELKRTAHAIFVLLYTEFGGKRKAMEAQRQLGVDASFVRYVGFLNDALTPKHRKTKKTN